jgi:hypothetical protein
MKIQTLVWIFIIGGDQKSPHDVLLVSELLLLNFSVGTDFYQNWRITGN